MPKETETPVIPTRETQATTRLVQIPLDQFVLHPERYCHRDPEELTEGRLKPLMESLVNQGIQVPVEFYKDDKGQPILDKGFRRITGMRLLAAQHTPNFVPNMMVDALEVIGATPQDLVLRSIMDNVARKTLSGTERMRAAKVLHDSGVPAQTAAFALGVSLKTLERDLLIARHGWMYQHVADESIGGTTAYRILEEAEKVGRVKEVKEDLDAWVVDQRRKIREKERVAKAQGKELKPRELLVKNYLPSYLVEHWLDAIKNGSPFDEVAGPTFAAYVDEEKGLLHVDSFDLPLRQCSPEEIVKTAGRLAQVAKELLPIAEQRGKEGPSGLPDVPYDLDFIRMRPTLGGYADKIEQELKGAEGVLEIVPEAKEETPTPESPGAELPAQEPPEST
jgi:hypothetical protein